MYIAVYTCAQKGNSVLAPPPQRVKSSTKGVFTRHLAAAPPSPEEVGSATLDAWGAVRKASRPWCLGCRWWPQYGVVAAGALQAHGERACDQAAHAVLLCTLPLRRARRRAGLPRDRLRSGDGGAHAGTRAADNLWLLLPCLPLAPTVRGARLAHGHNPTQLGLDVRRHLRLLLHHVANGAHG